MSNDYDDIINLPHYEPKYHPRMSMWNRAAQFAPFAALTGYDAAIQESNRVTDDWIDLGESGNEELNRRMEMILSKLPEQPHVTIEYFVPDEHKEGGSYQSYTGQVFFYPITTSSTIMSTKPMAKPIVLRLECSPPLASGISSSTTT